MGYSVADGVRQRFTLKERDTETGLDYFGARYYASFQGRFTTGDPLLSSGVPMEPRSWNRYAYCLNSPLNYIDPKGLIWQTRTTVKDNVSTTEYKWVWQDDPEEGWTRVTDFWVDITASDGSTVGLRMNPNGPIPSAGLLFYAGLKLMGGDALLPSQAALNGYEITPNSAERARASATGAVDMMPNQAFDVGLAAAGFRSFSLARPVTFYRGTTGYDALETVGNQAINVERLAARQAGATLDLGEGLYMSRSPATARAFAEAQGAFGRQGGPAVVEMNISRFRFGQVQQSFGAVDRVTISNMAGHTQSFVPLRGLDFFNKHATFTISK
jgi:RHS repeat-associated protein